MIKYLLVFLFLINSSFSAFSTQKINLGVESINYYPLYGTFDSNDKNINVFNGLAADVFELYNKSQNNFQIIFKPMPIKRLFQEYLEHNSSIDAKFPDNPYWAADLKKEKDIKYSQSILNYTDGIFVLSSNKNAKVSDIKILGTMAGFTPIKFINEIKNNKIKIEESNNTMSLIEKLKQKRVDFIYVNKYVGQCKIAKLKYNDIIFDESLPYTSSKFYLSSIKYPELIKSFNSFLIKNSNNIEKIKESYLNQCK